MISETDGTEMSVMDVGNNKLIVKVVKRERRQETERRWDGYLRRSC
jgi:hypothetical protein